MGPGPLRLVGRRDRVRLAAGPLRGSGLDELGVGIDDGRHQPLEHPQAAPRQLGARTRQLGIEHPQRRLVVGVAPEALLEQGVALAQHPVVAGPHRLVPRRDRCEQVVEVAATLPRATLDELEVVGREHGDLHQLTPVAGPGERVTVETDPVPAGEPDLGFEELVPPAVHDLGTHDRRLRPRAHERRVADASERRAGRGPRGSLEQTGLALRVGAHDERHTRGKPQLGTLVTAEVDQRQCREVHALRDPDGHEQVEEVGGAR